MFQFLFNRYLSDKRRSIRSSFAPCVEFCESRTLLSAASPVPAEISVEHAQNEARQAQLNFASLANFNGNWQIAAGSALHFTQVGNAVTGTQTVVATTVANFTGQVHGKKLTGELTSIGIDAHSTIKIHLTDATHFSGKRHFFVNGASAGTKTIVGVKN